MKPLAGFHRHPRALFDRRSRCKDCMCAWRRAHYDSASARAYQQAYKASASQRATFETRRCQQCDRQFRFYSSLDRARPGQGKYCSVGCKSAAGRVAVNCDKCGRSFTTWRSVHRRFCSLECAGRVATARTLTKGQSLYSRPHWRRQLRQLVLDRDGHLCQRCEATRDLVVHHIRPWRVSHDNSLDNLVTVCRACHMAIHGAATDPEFVPLFQRREAVA